MHLVTLVSRARAARAIIAGVFVVLAIAAPFSRAASAKAAKTAHARTSKLVVVSTTDVKGKTGPCGCHVPKGGLSRLAHFADSLRAGDAPVLLVDAGGFFPEADTDAPVAAFMMDAMKVIGTDAAAVTERELRFGRGFLLANAKRTGVPLVCANLLDRASQQPLVAPWRIVTLGGTKVGVFGVTSDKADLGPSRDSLTVEDPTTAARRAVAELRQQGATVIVLLSQVGKVEAEDLVVAVDGIDAVIIGRNVPLYQKGRMVKNTIACYGGEQGQYAGVTTLELDATGHMRSADNTTVMLGPEVADSPAMFATVKGFEDHWNDEKQRRKAEQQP